MAKYKHNINGVEVDFTAEEEAIKDAETKAWNDAKADRKLAEIKERLGQPNLARSDGTVHMMRYDSSSCRLFIFFS